MDAHISFQGNVTSEESYQLTKLAELIEGDGDLPVQINKSDPQEGIKDGGLIIGLTIAGLVLSSISTLVSVLSYWKSQQPRYSISITRGNTKVVIDNIPPEQLQPITTKLEKESASSDIKVLISGE